MSTVPLRRLETPAPPPLRDSSASPGTISRPLSILHLITRLDRGGSSDCTLLQALGAARRGHRVTVACGPSTAVSPLLERAQRQPGLVFHEIPTLARPVRPLRDLWALADILRLLRKQRFDVIHLHTSKAGALGRIAALAARRRRNVIYQPHGHLFYGYYGRIGVLIVRGIERLLAPLSRLHIALSGRGAEEHLELGIGRPGQYRVVRSGIDLGPLRRAARRRDECRRRLGYGDHEIVVGTLCRLEPIKGVEELVRGFLKAASCRSRLHLHLGGHGPLRDPLLSLARRSGRGDRVTANGAWVSPESVLPAFDIFVLASRNEGMGRALVEAMAVGLPVVGSSVGGVPEVLEGGRAGILVPTGDIDEIARAIGRLADDGRLSAVLGRRARLRAVAFGAGRMNRTLLRLYEEVAG